MKKTQWWHKYALLVGIFAFVTLIGFMILNTFIWSSFEEKQITAENEKVGLQEKLEDAKKADTLIEQLTTQIEQLIGGNDSEKGKLDKNIDIPDLLRELETASAKSGFEVSSIALDGTGNYVKRPTLSVTTAEGTVNIYNIGLSLDVNGSYEAMQTFIKSFEDSGYYVTVQSIEVDRQETLINKDIEGSIRLVIYSTTSGGITAKEIGEIVENNEIIIKESEEKKDELEANNETESSVESNNGEKEEVEDKVVEANIESENNTENTAADTILQG